MRRGRNNNKKLLISIAAVALSVGPSVAQQGPSTGVTGSLQLTTGLRAETNPGLAAVSPGTQLRLSENLSFNISSDTRTQSLSFNTSAALRFTNLNGVTDVTTTDPTFNLSYSRDAANASLTASAQYFSTDVTASYDIDPSSAVVLVVDDGNLEKISGQVNLQTGKNSPVGLDFGLSHSVSDFSGTMDPTLFDTTTTSASVTANLRFSPVTSGTVSARLSNFDADNTAQTNTVTENYGVSVSHDLARGLTLSANAGVQRREVTTTSSSSSRTGFRAGLSATQALPDGNIFARVGLDQTGLIDRTSVTVGRSMTLPAGNLSGSITATDVAGQGLQYQTNASYDQQLADGSFGVQLSQSLTTNNFDEDVLFSRLGLRYQQQVTSNSNLNLSVDLTRSEDGGAGAVETQNRSGFTASYGRALTPDWNLTMGYRYRGYSSDSTSPTDSNAVFLTLTRNIQFGF